MLLVDGVPLGDIVASRDENEGWTLLLALLRHPKIIASAVAFKQQKAEVVDAPEDRGNPPSPTSVHEQAAHGKSGKTTPSASAGPSTVPSSEAGPSTQQSHDAPSRAEYAPREAGGPGAEAGTSQKALESQEPREDTSAHPPTGSEDRSSDEPSIPGGAARSRIVYVCQRERATVLPSFVDVVGTDEMTTCIAMALRDPETGRTSVAHVDGLDCIKSGVTAMLLSMEPVNGPLELHLVGGYDDADELDDEDLTGLSFPASESLAASESLGEERRESLGQLAREDASDSGRLEAIASPSSKGGPLDASRQEENLKRSHNESPASVSGRGDPPSEGKLRGHALGKRSREEEDQKDEDESRRNDKGKDEDPIGRQLFKEDSLGELSTRSSFEDEDIVAPSLGGQSWHLAAALIGILHQSNVCLDVKTACILAHNTWRVRELGSLAMPVVRGLGVEPKSGRAFPVTFTANARGPDSVVRGVCMMACGPDPRWQGVLTVPYQTATDTYHVGPCQYERMDSVARQMQAMDDRDLISLTSTSPTCEGPDFLPTTRKVLAFLMEHPNWWEVFPFDQPRVFVRTENGGWKRTA